MPEFVSFHASTTGRSRFNRSLLSVDLSMLCQLHNSSCNIYITKFLKIFEIAYWSYVDDFIYFKPEVIMDGYMQ